MPANPNLIYVFADQLRRDAISCNGGPKGLTPNLDALYRQSLDLNNAVSGHPVCAPYRASLMTGKYTTSTGMVINEIRLNPEHRCFAHVLNDGGYENAYIGKWHLYAAEWGNHYDPKNSYTPKGPDRLGFDGYFAAFGFHHEYYGDPAYYHLDSPEKIHHKGYEPDCQTDMAIDQLTRLSRCGKPFSLFLSLGTPHDPWVPSNVPPECLERVKDIPISLPPNYLPDNDPYADNWARFFGNERDELIDWMRCYYAMVANLDDNIGRLTKAIHDLKLDENSILVFTSDHGELFGAHGRRAKNIFYEEAVRVPFIMRWKGVIGEHEQRDICLNTVDIMPTLLSLMGLRIPDTVEGADLSQYIRRSNITADNGALMMCCGPTATYGDGNEWRAYRTKRYTYAIFKKDGAELLFDHINDPYQMHDLSDSPNYQALLKELRERMWEKMNRINDTFESNSYYEKHWIRDRLIIRTATQNADTVL